MNYNLIGYFKDYVDSPLELGKSKNQSIIQLGSTYSAIKMWQPLSYMLLRMSSYWILANLSFLQMSNKTFRMNSHLNFKPLH